MGFRSTFCTEDHYIHWPEWFVEKYRGLVAFKQGNMGALHSISELKTYGAFAMLHEDIQKAINWEDDRSSFVLVYLHECGGITRCQIYQDRIVWSEPASWRATSGVEHSYCYGCSEIRP
jgi:hypothetical protein